MICKKKARCKMRSENVIARIIPDVEIETKIFESKKRVNFDMLFISCCKCGTEN